MRGVPKHIRSDDGLECHDEGSARMAREGRSEDIVHRVGLSVGERLRREFRQQVARRVTERRNDLLNQRNTTAHRAVAQDVEHHQAAKQSALPTSSTAVTDAMRCCL